MCHLNLNCYVCSSFFFLYNFGAVSHEYIVFPDTENIADNVSDDDTSDDNLVGEASSEHDEETSNRPSEDDFKTEADISRKVLENLIKSSEKSEPSGSEGSDVDTDTETEDVASEKEKSDSLVAAKLAKSKSVTDAEISNPASKPKKNDTGLDRTIFISNLPFDISNEEVTARFSVFGKVESFFPVLHKLTKYVCSSCFTFIHLFS